MLSPLPSAMGDDKRPTPLWRIRASQALPGDHHTPTTPTEVGCQLNASRSVFGLAPPDRRQHTHRSQQLLRWVVMVVIVTGLPLMLPGGG